MMNMGKALREYSEGLGVFPPSHCTLKKWHYEEEHDPLHKVFFKSLGLWQPRQVQPQKKYSSGKSLSITVQKVGIQLKVRTLLPV